MLPARVSPDAQASRARRRSGRIKARVIGPPTCHAVAHNPFSLRNTMARWQARGEFDAVMRAGEPAMQRMRRQYRQHIADLSINQGANRAHGRVP